ncbi:peptidase [Phycicoccus duodecadis]|uniref:peptidase n=1 Tax=Phycicoccus duodecadis TaxID=173053 RepID=UPI00117DE445|nr:peptidase [Phycicoccus duodecadis]
MALIIGGWLAGPRVPEWVDRMFPARPALAVGEERPEPPEGSTSRILPPVVVSGVPPSTTFDFMVTQNGSAEPVTFDPCRPIRFVVRDALGAGPRGREAVTRAVAAVSAASGLSFEDAGDTDEAPARDRALYQPDRYGESWAPVLIAWSNPAEEPELAGRTAGLGGGRPLRDTHGRMTYVSGTVWLDTPSLAPDLTTPEGFIRVQAVIMHELSHVLGAGHVQDSRELMAEENSGRTDFGIGDRYALSQLGRGACVPGL